MLESAIAEHNRTTAKPIVHPPFTALGPVRAYISITEGGLAVTDDLRVLGRDESRSPACSLPALPAKAEFCSTDTGITSPGRSFPADKRHARRWG